jgi:hypothetical protein
MGTTTRNHASNDPEYILNAENNGARATNIRSL